MDTVTDGHLLIMIVPGEDGEGLDAAAFGVLGIDDLIEVLPVSIMTAHTAGLVLEEDGGFVRGGEILGEPGELFVINDADAGEVARATLAMDGLQVLYAWAVGA